MKKSIIYGLSILLIAGASMSCRKTSKGKMSNEWKLESYTSTETTTYDDGDVTGTNVDADATSITVTQTQTPNGGSTTTTTLQGDVNEYSFVINKDGTWEETMDVTYTSTQNSVTVVDNERTVSSGTWNFLGNVEEFKKNERVVFNTLNERVENETTSTFNGVSQTENTTEVESFANGENAEIMLVVESKRKELQLMTERDYTSQETQGGSTDTYTVVAKQEWSLVQED